MNENVTIRSREALIAAVESWKQRLDGPSPVLAYLDSSAPSSFIRQNIALAWVSRKLEQNPVVAVYKDDGGLNSFITSCNGFLSATLTQETGSEAPFPLDWLDVGMSAPVKCPHPDWQKWGLDNAGIVFLPSMLNVEPSRLMGFQKAPPVFRIPADIHANHEQELINMGLDPDRWFACVGIPPRPSDYWRILIKTITEDLGGQVLVFTEATGDPDSLLLNPDVFPATINRNYAAPCFARFVISTRPDDLALSGAFGVPLAAVNVMNHSACIWNPMDIVYEGHNGQEERLPEIADRLSEKTTDTPTWRIPAQSPEDSPVSRLSLPLQQTEMPSFEIWE